jgi:Ras-related protein Rab-1A
MAKGFRTIVVDDETVKLQIWDTTGQERYNTLTSSYYRGAHGVVIVFDLTDRETFEHLPQWISDVNKHAGDDTLKLILANKADDEYE